MTVYKSAFEQFSSACRFSSGGKEIKKSIACLKHALKIDGVIGSDLVAKGTRSLDEHECGLFESRYREIKKQLNGATDPIWISRSD
jgi:hypothetical protein